jgi:hypothetical protein
VSTYINTLSGHIRRVGRRGAITLGGGGALTTLAVWLATSRTAEILQQATGETGKGTLTGSNTNLFTLVNGLLGPALIIVVALAPLAIAWGAAAMIFGGRHGPQIMGSAIVAVVLVAAAKGIAA